MDSGYNGVGTRVSKTDSAGSATFMRNGVGVTAPVLSDGAANFTPGISERRNSATKHYGADLKNEVAQVSTMQTISASKQYDAFGNVVSSSGTWNGPFSYGGKFGYQTDTDTSYQLLGHRYYDPSTGRFLTRDPAKDGRNWFGYCFGNPVVKSDPTGLSMTTIGIILTPTRPGFEAMEFSGSGIYIHDLGGLMIAAISDGVVDNVGDYKKLFPQIEKIEGKNRAVFTDCGNYVGYCVQPVDPNYPGRGTGIQQPYLEGAANWRRVDGPDYVSLPGDVAIRRSGGKGHTLVRGMDGWNQASWGDHEPRAVSDDQYNKRYKGYRKYRLSRYISLKI